MKKLFLYITCREWISRKIRRTVAVEEVESVTKDRNDPNNPFWVIYTINLEVMDIYVQTFENEKEARGYVDELQEGDTLKTFFSSQIHLCSKEQSNKVIDNIDTLDGREKFVDHLDKMKGNFESV